MWCLEDLLPKGLFLMLLEVVDEFRLLGIVHCRFCDLLMELSLIKKALTISFTAFQSNLLLERKQFVEQLVLGNQFLPLLLPLAFLLLHRTLLHLLHLVTLNIDPFLPLFYQPAFLRRD